MTACRHPLLSPQLYEGSLRPCAERLAPVAVHYPGPKPDEGGLWTSSERPGGVSDWMRWCVVEGYKGPAFHVWRLHPDPVARVFVIAGLAELLALAERYPSRCPIRSERIYPDWTALAADYDAVHLTEAGQWATRLTRPANLYGWDCESTLWLRWAFAAVERVGPVHVRADAEQLA